jgi:hypothetical protein
MSEWRDISTAPKDGYEILVRDASSGIKPHYVAYWITGTGWLIWADDKAYKTCNPTHWMPIPGDEELPDEIDLYQFLKGHGLRRRSDIAKALAAFIRGSAAPHPNADEGERK